MAKHLLIIGAIWPEPTSTAAGNRMMQLIELFQKNEFQITFVSAASTNENSFPLESLNINTAKVQLNHSGFDVFLKQLNPTIVLFDRFITEEQYSWRVSEICPNSIRILDTEDLHFLRHARHKAFKENEEVASKYLINEITKREIASIYRCDLSLIISKYEYSLLINTFKIDSSLLIYIPFLIHSINSKKVNSYPTYSERKHFMTIGNFKHKPNWNSVLYLKNTIWPLIRKKMPSSEMHVYGAYATEKVKQLHNENNGFLIKGWVEDTAIAYKNSRICLAPLQFGAGLKGKLIDAMQFGTPSITTTIGAEAMHDNLPWNGYICNDPIDFAEKAVELYKDKEQWYLAQQNGYSVINKCYSMEKFIEFLVTRIQHLQNNINDHRLNNFIGAMLMQHTLKSTKYFSKWIELKNLNS